MVPEFKKNTNGQFVILPDGNYELFEKDYPNTAPFTHKVRFYKPRSEGLYARIEGWTEMATGIISWRVFNRDNITTLFGWTDNTRTADPLNSTHIYEWLPEFVFDDKGNCCRYSYLAEITNSVNGHVLHDRNRVKNNQLTFTNRYLEKILYGNTEPYKNFGDPFTAKDKFLFKIVFDYAEPGDSPDITTALVIRNDSFSDYKSGFEIRTTHLCKRVLLFHHFAEYNELVKFLNIK